MKAMPGLLLLVSFLVTEEAPRAKPAPAGREAEIDAFLEAWGKRSREIRSLALRFQQEKKLRILRRPRVSEGDLVYADRKLSVVIRAKDGSVESEILMKDGELKIHYPRLKRVEVLAMGGGNGPPAGGAAGFTMPVFADDPKNLKRDFEISLLGPAWKDAAPGNEERTLELLPKDPKSPLKKIRMTFRGLDFREYVQVDGSGDESRMTITASEMNPEVPPDRFELDLAEGTTFVRLDGK
jgi:hypothetical protein